VEQILKVHLSLKSIEDQLIWAQLKNAAFTIESAFWADGERWIALVCLTNLIGNACVNQGQMRD
jgi:hypothetical protein